MSGVSLQSYRVAASRSVWGLGRAVDVILLVVLILSSIRTVLYFSAELNRAIVAQQLDRVFDPTRLFFEKGLAAVGLPLSLGPIPLGLIALIILIVVVRNTLNWRLDLILVKDRRRKVAAGFKRYQPAEEEEDEESRLRREAMARRVAVESYTEARHALEATKMELTFVSLDVVGSRKMKHGEDPFVIEQAFTDYRNLVENQLNRFNAYKSTWTPDGQMAAFHSRQEAVDCSKAILLSLDSFNREVSKMKTPFAVRIGVNTGIVSTDDLTPMEKISDSSIDATGHLQKYAAPDTIWMSENVYENLEDKSGVSRSDEVVDGHEVYVWGVPQ